MIYYRNHVRASGVDSRALKRTLRALLHAVNESSATVSVSLVTDTAIRRLNRAHRGLDSPTDVLSFPLDAPPRSECGDGPERMLGDIVISLDTARRQAAEYDASLQAELYRLLIHGLLHILGYDHVEAQERSRMELQERLLAQVIELPWPYEDAS